MVESYQDSKPDLKQYFKLENLTANEKAAYIKLNQTIKKVTEDSERLQFNTMISALMELIRDYDPREIKNEILNDYVILKAIQLIAPMAPHLAEEMWSACKQQGSVFRSPWPEADESALVFDTFTIAVQINGKLRGQIEIKRDASEAQVIDAVKKSERITGYLGEGRIVKTIYIPGKLLNIVIK
jgi:leucyl-tRNA synthetase